MSSSRSTAPKFLLSAVFVATRHLRYYPTLVNGLSSRSLIILRMFDATSLSWLFSAMRMSLLLSVIFLSIFSVHAVWAGSFSVSWLSDVLALLGCTVSACVIILSVIISVISLLLFSPFVVLMAFGCGVAPFIIFFQNAAWGLVPMGAAIAVFNHLVDCFERSEPIDWCYLTRVIIVAGSVACSAVSIVPLFLLVALSLGLGICFSISIAVQVLLSLLSFSRQSMFTTINSRW